MSNYLIQDSTLDNIADAIRDKAGTQDLISPTNMPAAIIAANQIPVNPSDPSLYTAYIVDSQDGLSLNLPSNSGNYQQKTVTPTGQQIVVTPDQGYDALSQVTIDGDADLVAGNIKKDVEIYGVTGTYEASPGSYQQKSVTPTGQAIVVEPDQGYDALSQVSVAGDSNLVAANIKKDVNIYGVTGTYEGGSGEVLLWTNSGSTYAGGSTGVTIETCKSYSKIRIDYAPTPAYESTHKYLMSYYIDAARVAYIERTTYEVTDTYNMALTAVLPHFNSSYTAPSSFDFMARGLFFSSADRNLYFAKYVFSRYANGSTSSTDQASLIPRAIYGIP